MAAVLLACASAALFGAMSVAVRFAVRRFDDVELGSLAMKSVALALTAAICLVAARGTDLVDAWPFLVSGAIAPGTSQIFFVRAVRDAGAARASVVMGTAPLVAVAIALTVLREPVSAALLAGGALIVAGSIALADERVRPADFRRLSDLLRGHGNRAVRRARQRAAGDGEGQRRRPAGSRRGFAPRRSDSGRRLPDRDAARRLGAWLPPRGRTS